MSSSLFIRTVPLVVGDFQNEAAAVLHNGTVTYSGVAQLARAPDSDSGG